MPQVKNILKLRFFLFIFALSILGTQWSFGYVAKNNKVFFHYVMWALFVFYVTVFLFLAALSIEELIDRAVYTKKLRKLEVQQKRVTIERAQAENKVILHKLNDTIEDKSVALPPPSLPYQYDLSNWIKVKPVYPLLETISDKSRILVVGGQGSGKTQIMLWLAAEKLKNTKVLAIDTHASPGKWPKGAYVLGFELNYEAAQTGFNQLLALMTKRYKEVGAGLVAEGSHTPITVLSDEWTDLPDWIPNFQKIYVKPFFTRARKANVNLSLAAHDDTAEALGMSGLAKLKRSFDVVVYCTKTVDGYVTKLRYGLYKGAPELDCYPPGPFVMGKGPELPTSKHLNFSSVGSIEQRDIYILEQMRNAYNVNSDAIWKQDVRKLLRIPASPDAYKMIEDVAAKYNITLK